MTAPELLEQQISKTAAMLDVAVAGVDEAHLDYRAHETMMSYREHLAHLTECSIASLALLQGQEHAWGSYSPVATDLAGLVAELKAKRAEAVKLIFTVANEDAINTGADYILQHDHYHLGQMAATRQAFEPGWSSYALYS